MGINGRKLGSHYCPISRDWVKTGENTYANDEMSTQIPEEFRPEEPRDIRVKYEVAFYDHSRKTAMTDNPDVMEIFPEVEAYRSHFGKKQIPSSPADGARLREEILEMSLPENLELGEGQRLLKLRGAYHPYVIVELE